MSSTVPAQKKKKAAAKSKETIEQKIEEEVVGNVGMASNDLDELTEQTVELNIEQKVEEVLGKETKNIETKVALLEAVVESLNIDTNIIQNIIPTIEIPSRSIVEIINEEIKQKALVLNKDYVDVINILVKKSPTLFNDIEKSIYEIMKDGKVDSNDIPHLIKIIQKLYESIFSLKGVKLSNEKQTAICSELMKNVFKIMIKERKIKLELNKQEQFLDQFNKLIESCTSLLSFQKILKSKGCFSCLF